MICTCRQYCSCDRIKRNEVGGVRGNCGGEERYSTYRVLVARPEGKRPLGKSRRRWDGNIKIDLKEIF